ncbi:MAG: hypothetical protein NE330_22715 [Lentisphaeraceae bacterium]|nr:hypothetical protein [Lentisphaeraceae bacterium]
MNTPEKYFIRIPTSNLKECIESVQNFGEVIPSQKKHSAWLSIKGFVFEVSESEDQYASLVKYVNDSQIELDKLDALGIVCDFTAEDDGNNFEASFYEPGGIKIIIAESDDLPKSLLSVSLFPEFSIPSCSSFTDSINFWSALGFTVNSNKAKDHAWVQFESNCFLLGIHQHYKWSEPAITFSGDTDFEFDFSHAGLRIKKHFSDFL